MSQLPGLEAAPIAAGAAGGTRNASFDAARSAMMLLGVLAHVILIAPHFLYVDSSQRIILDAVFWGIHVFRMPTFFLLSGFFAVALVTKSGYKGFLISRFKRVVSVLLAAELIIAAVFMNTECTACSVAGANAFPNYGWLHLWFLAYLAIIAHCYLLLRWLGERYISRTIRHRVASASHRLAMQPLMLATYAALTCLIPGYLDEKPQLRMSMALAPDMSLLAVFAVFFGVGVLLFRTRAWAIQNLINACWVNLVVAVMATSVSLNLHNHLTQNWLPKFSYTLAMWFYSAAVLGLFAKYLTKPRPTLGYLSEASYWVYLWHPAIVLALAWQVGQWRINLWLAMLLIIAITLTATIASYHLFVRKTLIGPWISGRRRSELGLPNLFKQRLDAKKAAP